MGTLCMGCMQVKQSNPRCEHCGYDERSQNNTHQLPVGTIVGRQYTLGKVLGQGGFGITYVGWDNIMQQRVAVKEYFPSGYAGRGTHSLTVTSYDGAGKQDFESNKRRFLREADALAKLQNVPQIVRILRHFEENGTAYIAMEYVEGMDLRKYLKQHRGPLSMEETLTILGPVIQALAQVHRAELVHRDISPDNIMVLPDGSTKLLDFGAARYVRNANAYEDRDTSTQAILKHGFAPPEQYSTHGALGPWTDVYAMCATVYYCLTGRVPPEAMIRSVEGAAMNWDGIPGLTKQQKAALEKGMTLQPGKRFASMEELWQQLKPAEPKPEPRKHKKSKSNKPLLITAVAATAVAVAMISMNFLPKDIRELPQETQQIQVPETASDAGEEPSIPAETGTVFTPDNLIPETPVVDVKFTYEDNETGITITGYEGQWNPIPESTEETMPSDGNNGELNQDMLPEHLLIPAQIDGKTVTAIGEEAFSGCTKLVNVSLPDSILAIGKAAFSGCTGLQSFTIPDGVEIIEPSTFKDCSGLTTIGIPDHIAKIGGSAFSGCIRLTNVTIPSTVTEIGWYAFSNCTSLTSITIPGSVSDILVEVFKDCTGLTNVILKEGVQRILGGGAFSGCTALLNVSMPQSLTYIEASTFEGCSSLTSIVIPDNVTHIGSDAFYGCIKLENVSLPVKITHIGATAFDKTVWLDSQTEEFVIVGDGILIQYNGTESNVVIPSAVKMISSAFYHSENIVSVTIPDSVTTIGEAAFCMCTGLIRVHIPNSVTAIEENAFTRCYGLSQINIPNSVTQIGDHAFRECTALTSITIPGSVKKIGEYAFQSCEELTRVVIEEGVESIDGVAFSGCDKLNFVSIPRSVTEIGTWAFSSCNLSSVTISKDCKFGMFGVQSIDDVFDETCVVNYY